MNKYCTLLWMIFACFSAMGQENGFAKSKDGTEIYFQTSGQGKPILVINGGPGFSSEGFLPLANEIADLGYQAILFDQRGTGKSGMEVVDSSTVSLELMAQDMEAIRHHLKIDEWILFGHSFGGMLANFYTSRYPQRVSAIIHSSSGGMDLVLLHNSRNNLEAHLLDWEVDSLRYWRNQFYEHRTLENRRKFNQFLARAYVVSKEFVPQVSERLMVGKLGLNRLVWQDLNRINFDCKPALRSFQNPVLIIQGKQDVIPESIAIKASEVFENSRMVILDQCAHYGWLDQNELYLNEIERFLLSLKREEQTEQGCWINGREIKQSAMKNWVDSLDGFAQDQAWSYSDFGQLLLCLQKGGVVHPNLDFHLGGYFLSLNPLDTSGIQYYRNCIAVGFQEAISYFNIAAAYMNCGMELAYSDSTNSALIAEQSSLFKQAEDNLWASFYAGNRHVIFTLGRLQQFIRGEGQKMEPELEVLPDSMGVYVYLRDCGEFGGHVESIEFNKKEDNLFIGKFWADSVYCDYEEARLPMEAGLNGKESHIHKRELTGFIKAFLALEQGDAFSNAPKEIAFLNKGKVLLIQLDLSWDEYLKMRRKWFGKL